MFLIRSTLVVSHLILRVEQQGVAGPHQVLHSLLDGLHCLSLWVRVVEGFQIPHDGQSAAGDGFADDLENKKCKGKDEGKDSLES